jgi:hypothetical protein
VAKTEKSFTFSSPISSNMSDEHNHNRQAPDLIPIHVSNLEPELEQAPELVEQEEEQKQSQSQSSSNTIVIFGGNGFVGTRICELAINKSYRVISVSRSGQPNWTSEFEWANKVEWFKADALKPETYSDYIRAQQPLAKCTMMGVFNFWTIMNNDVSHIERLSGTTNINVCHLAASIESVKRFVYVGANVGKMNLDENSKPSFGNKLMLGQYRAKTSVEKCVDELFGVNGITFRPSGIIAGYEPASFLGYTFMKNKLPLYDYGWAKNVYHYFSPQRVTAQQLAQDCLQFIELEMDFQMDFSEAEQIIEEVEHEHRSRPNRNSDKIGD